MTRCAHCPTAGDCPGLRASRLCELIDPAHSDFEPAYAAAIAAAADGSARPRPRPPAVAIPGAVPTAELRVDYGLAERPHRCCG